MRSKRTYEINRYEGHISGRGATKADARADLQRQIDHLCTNAAHGPHIEIRRGVALILAATATGFEYRMIDAEKLASRDADNYAGLCCFTAPDFDAALDIARSAHAQRAWTPDVENDAAFIAEFRLTAARRIELARLFGHYRDHPAAA